MRNPVKERASFAARHDFDSLPTATDIEVRFAQYSELSFLADMARRMVPGVQLTASSLGRYFTFDPECILTFSRRGKLLGGVALLYFNSRGHDALILDEISLAQPDLGLLAGRDDEVSANYIWALRQLVAGLPDMARSPRICERRATSMPIASPSPRPGRGANSWSRPVSSRYRASSRTSGVMSAPGIAIHQTCRRPSSRKGGSQMHGTKKVLSPANPNPRAISVRIARDPNDLMLVTAIRAAVYLAEQDCPIEEEFDGNDLVAAHFIGFVGSEPAGCLRVRFFGEFAKVERLAVRHQFRRSRVSFKLVQASVDYIKRKGFRKIYGQAQDRLVDFWAHFGAKPLGHNRKLTFSDFSYTEMVLDIEPDVDAITLDSDPYVIIRPEGDWDRPGILDISAGRAATSPLRTA